MVSARSTFRRPARLNDNVGATYALRFFIYERFRNMKRSHLLTLLAVCFGLAAFGATVLAQRPGQGEGQGQRQGQQREIPANFQIRGIQEMTEGAQQSMWAFVSLEMDTSDEQLIALRPIVAKSWKETQAIFAAVEEAGEAADIAAAVRSATQNISALRESVRDQLNDEQKESLNAWFEEQRAAIERQRQQRRQRFGDFQGRQRGDGEQTAPREGRRPAPEAERDNDSDNDD